MAGGNRRNHRGSRKGSKKGGSNNKSTTSQMNEPSLEEENGSESSSEEKKLTEDEKAKGTASEEKKSTEDEKAKGTASEEKKVESGSNLAKRVVDSLFSRLLSREDYGSIVKDEAIDCSQKMSDLINRYMASYPPASEEKKFDDPELVDHFFLQLMSPVDYELLKSEIVKTPQEMYGLVRGILSQAPEQGQVPAAASSSSPRVPQSSREAKRQAKAVKVGVVVVDKVVKVGVFGVHPLGFVSPDNAEVLDEVVELLVDDLLKKKGGGVEHLPEQVRRFVAINVENRDRRRRQASSSSSTPPAQEEVAPVSEKKEKKGAGSAADEEEKKGAGSAAEGSSSGTIIGVTPPSPPSYFVHCESTEITGDFSYLIQGIFKDAYLFGITSRSKTLEPNRLVEVTIVPFKSIQSANHYCEALVKFKDSPRVVHFVYLNEREFHVLIDRIHMDLPMYIDSIVDHDWPVCQVEFSKTFREIAIALSEIFKEGHYSVLKLLDLGTLSLSVDTDVNVKVANLVKNKDKDSISDRSMEMTDLAVTMSTFLTNVNETVPDKVRLRNQNVPDAVINFISQCYFMTSPNINQLRWMLDFSGFWDAQTTKDWVYMASAVIWRWILLGRVANRLDSILLSKLKSKDWREFIPRFGRIKRVFDDFAGSAGNVCEFNALIRFFRNVLEHYDDPFLPHDMLGDDGICELMESYFKGNLVVILRETLYEALLMRNPLEMVDWRDMLTLKMK